MSVVRCAWRYKGATRSLGLLVSNCSSLITVLIVVRRVNNRIIGFVITLARYGGFMLRSSVFSLLLIVVNLRALTILFFV